MKTFQNLLCIGTTLIPTSIFADGHNNQVLLDEGTYISVDQSSDSLDGLCSQDQGEAIRGRCNLRAAIAEALKQEGSTIVLLVDSQIDQGALAIAPTYQAQSPLKILSASEEQKKIKGSGLSRLFEITANARVQISGVWIGEFSAYEGGAIINHGHLELENTTFFANKASCFGTGAMTAYATCGGGAINNVGTLVLKNGSRFEQNEVSARASTASFTNAYGHGGAVSSSGALVFDGAIVFEKNSVTSEANSGIHPMPAGGALANAFGGALSSFNGTLELSATLENCLFEGNLAKADASTHIGDIGISSRGGAIYATGGGFELASSVCTFQGNSAAEDSDLAFVPML